MSRPCSSSWTPSSWRALYSGAAPQPSVNAGEFEASWLNAEAELSEISVAIGSHRFMDLPDGGSVTLAEQVRRMRIALEEAEARAPVSGGEGEAVVWFWVKGSYPLCGREVFAKSKAGLGEWPDDDKVEIVPLYTHPSDPDATERMRAALEGVLNTSGARGAYHALKYEQAVKDAEAVLAALGEE